MASPIIWPQGLFGSGVDTATLFPDMFSGAAIWVDFATGNDANAGTEPELPVKTIATAFANVAAGGVIAISAAHNEITASAIAVNKAGVRFVGFGTGTARATLQPASGAAAVFTVSVADVVFDNIYFKAAQATSGTGGRVTCSSTGLEVQGCQFDCGASDQEALVLSAGADSARIENTNFTATASRPTRAIALTGSNTNVKLINVTVDGATFGWAGTAVSCNGVTRMVAKKLQLAGNADMIGTATVSYQLFGVTSSGAGRVQLT